MCGRYIVRYEGFIFQGVGLDSGVGGGAPDIYLYLFFPLFVVVLFCYSFPINFQPTADP